MHTDRAVEIWREGDKEPLATVESQVKAYRWLAVNTSYVTVAQAIKHGYFFKFVDAMDDLLDS
jgi:hypothetical protein